MLNIDVRRFVSVSRSHSDVAVRSPSLEKMVGLAAASRRNMRADALGPKKPGRRGGRSLVERVPWAAVTVAFVVAVAAFKEIRYLGVPFTSSGDPAYTELSILRVFHGGVFLSARTPVLGGTTPGRLCSTYSHLIYGLSGDSSRALFLDSWLLNGASAIGTVLIAWKLAGPLASAVFAAVVLAFMDIVGYTTWINPWNPSMSTLPLLLLMTAAAGATSGSSRALGGGIPSRVVPRADRPRNSSGTPWCCSLFAAGGFSFAWWAMLHGHPHSVVRMLTRGHKWRCYKVLNWLH